MMSRRHLRFARRETILNLNPLPIETCERLAHDMRKAGQSCRIERVTETTGRIHTLPKKRKRTGRKT